MYESLSKLFYKYPHEYENIYQSRFNGDFSSKCGFYIKEFEAFWCSTPEILNVISSIYKLEKQLVGLEINVPHVALTQFSISQLLEEIRLTNEIEGVHSTRKEIQAVVNNITSSKTNKRLYGLVTKYLLLLTPDSSYKINNCNDIREIYDQLLKEEIELSGTENIPDGTIFRKIGVEVYSDVQIAIHRGLEPEEKIISVMDQVLFYLNHSKDPMLIKIAIFHYAFGYIHPFYDGNGRTSRFISSYLLAGELDILVSISISHTIKKNIKQYYNSFKIANDPKNKGDLTPFVLSFMQMIEETIVTTIDSLTGKKDKLDYFFKKIPSLAKECEPIANLLYILLQNSLFAYSGIGLSELADAMEVSTSYIRKYLTKIPSKYIRITKNGKRNLYDINLDEFSNLESYIT